jgi:hypothetical protein
VTTQLMRVDSFLFLSRVSVYRIFSDFLGLLYHDLNDAASTHATVRIISWSMIALTFFYTL